MQLHELRSNHPAKKKKRVGRGGKRGSYSGRGIKGQKSRAGRKLKPEIRELIKRYPKLRGYKFNPRRHKLTEVNLEILEKRFSKSDLVSPASLVEQKIIRRFKGRLPRVKILGNGQLSKALVFENCQVFLRFFGLWPIFPCRALISKTLNHFLTNSSFSVF